MTPHRCPVCEGRGFMPLGFYQVGDTVGGTATAWESCRSCNGQGIVWEFTMPPPYVPPVDPWPYFAPYSPWDGTAKPPGWDGHSVFISYDRPPNVDHS